jgi:hypothetical protein
MTRMRAAILAVTLAFGASAAWAKIPPPPPPDEKAKAAAEEKKAKDATAAEKAKADLDAAIDRAVKNYQGNMKKAGKPIPKPTPIVAAAPQATPTPAKPGEQAAKGSEKPKDAKK